MTAYLGEFQGVQHRQNSFFRFRAGLVASAYSTELISHDLSGRQARRITVKMCFVF